jgi:nitrite reductase/ring-hydroxylating ferredoxin subunit/uncharacterized membrane protein
MSEQIIRAIENEPLTGRVADAVQPVVRKMLQSLGTESKDALHGKWLGHPLHAALVALPIGAWTLAFLCDVAEIVSGKRSRPAEMAISVGLAGAVASAVTGLADWSEIDGRAKKIGLVHGTMNLVATALYFSSLATRRRSRSTGMAMSMVAFGVANAAAYLGGHLVFGERIGVKHTGAPTEDQPESFVAVLDESALGENQLVRATAGEVPILLVRTSGRIFALGEICTHLGGPLAEGALEGTSVRCPWHGSRFCLEDGSVLESPATFPERTFDVRVRGGKIEVRASQA